MRVCTIIIGSGKLNTPEWLKLNKERWYSLLVGEIDKLDDNKWEPRLGWTREHRSIRRFLLFSFTAMHVNFFKRPFATISVLILFIHRVAYSPQYNSSWKQNGFPIFIFYFSIPPRRDLSIIHPCFNAFNSNHLSKKSVWDKIFNPYALGQKYIISNQLLLIRKN